MALTGTLLADFSGFIDESAKATAAVKTMESGADTAAAKLAKLPEAAGAGSSAFGTLSEQIAATFTSMVSAESVMDATSEAFHTLTAFVSESVAAYSKQEDASIQLTAALRQHGLATPEVISQYNALATSFQNTTKYADEDIAAMEKLLTVVGNVLPSKMQDALKASTDLAAGLGIDLEQATMLVAKAAAGHTETLGRYGITVDAAEVSSRGFAAVLDVINEKFGGQAAAAIETYAGKVAQAANAWDNVKEALGKIILEDPLVVDAINHMVNATKNADQAATDSHKSLPQLAADFQLIDRVTADAIDGVELFTGSVNDLAKSTSQAEAKLPKLVQQMANVMSNQDITAGFAIQNALVKEHEAQVKKDAKALADLKEAMVEVASAGEGWKGTLDTIDGAIVESIISYRNAQVQMTTLGHMYSDLSATQLAAIEKERTARREAATQLQKDLDAAAKLEAQTVEETTKLWDEYTTTRVKQMGTTTDIARAENDKQYNDAAAHAVKMGIVDAQYWDALEARWKQKNAAIGTDWAALTKAATTESKAGLQQIADGAQATYQEALKHVGEWSDASIEKFRVTAEEAQKKADMFGTAWADNADKAKKHVEDMADSTIGKIHAIAAASASATIAQGATQPYPDTVEGRLKQLADEQARYGPGTVINTSGLFGGLRDSGGPVTAGTSYLIGGGKAPELFTPGASGFVTPNAGGGGVVQHIYVTQPLGTPDAIARAVADAQIALMKGQGARLPYGG